LVLFVVFTESPTEAFLAKKRKSMEEAYRANDTCPHFFDESVLAAHQLQTSKEEISLLLKQIVSKTQEILSLNRIKAHFEKERSTVFRDACTLYKHGIIELQLSVFMNDHENDYHTFTCDGVVHQKTFTEAMHHWCECRHHKVEILKSHKEDRVNLRLYADEQAVKDSLWFLYDTLSGLLHFKAGEEFPIRIVPFARGADTLAFITFLNHYHIPMFLAPTHPIPSLITSSEKEDAAGK
jgi:hypothetical protein